MNRGLIVTYHGVEARPGPLWIDPGRFAAQLDELVGTGAHLTTMTELLEGLRSGELPPRSVAITFDDGLRSVVEFATPLLIERNLPATVFCVAGRLGGDNGWPTQPAGTERRPLASAAELRHLAAAGFEIGSHGMHHLPLHDLPVQQLVREVVDSKHLLEQSIGSAVSAFAYPYGVIPGPAARSLIGSTYAWACTTRAGLALAGDDPTAVPRVDAHYLRRPLLLRRAASGSLRFYLGLRRGAAAARRRVITDYAATPRGNADAVAASSGVR
jgi:peptidoglycan/xylan/chitin deacetylase (PgdA/CDA1 family)